jgi:molybdate transport system substrate-binding protein
MPDEEARLVVLVGSLLTGCGKSSPRASSTRVKFHVAAGVKLSQVFPQVGTLFTKAHPGVTFKFVFAVADQLVATIEQGKPADIFASISSAQGDELVTAHKMNAYKVFCTDPLLLTTPEANPAGITTLEDLRTKPVKLVVAEEESVTGTFTRMALVKLDTVLGPGYSAAVRSKVSSVEQGGSAVVEKVQSGQADAGFAFISDVAGAHVKAIALPAAAQAVSKCPIGVLRASKNPAVAHQFVDFMLTPPARMLLGQAGFGLPPASSP